MAPALSLYGAPGSNASLRILRRTLTELFHASPVEAVLFFLGMSGSAMCGALSWVEFTVVNSYSQTALNERNKGPFWQSQPVMFRIILKIAAFAVAEEFCAGRLAIRWCEVVTQRLIGQYLGLSQKLKEHMNGSKATAKVLTFPFYQMKLCPQAPTNPDQRISQDISETTEEAVDLLRKLVAHTTTFLAFSKVLNQNAPHAFRGLFLYALAGTMISLKCFSRGLVAVGRKVREREGFFRFALLRLDECAESIAFYSRSGGAAASVKLESQRLFRTLTSLLQSRRVRLGWVTAQGAFQKVYTWSALMLPSILMAPAYFKGEVDFGVISQMFLAFQSVQEVLLFVANNFADLASLEAKAVRLEELEDALDSCSSTVANGETVIVQEELRDADEDVLLQVRDLLVAAPHSNAIASPGQSSRFLGNISGCATGSCMEVRRGQSILIRGRSGVGKSSLLRAIAGLWSRGCSGKVRCRSGVEMFFLPQVAYIPAGGSGRESLLRDQLRFCGPETEAIEDARLIEIMNEVGLEKLTLASGVELPKHACQSPLDASRDWALMLSGGEQQRLAFARLLVQLEGLRKGSSPSIPLVLLDEATSSCDEESEECLYRALQSRLHDVGGALVSVGHRSSLRPFHDQAVVMEAILQSHSSPACTVVKV